LVPPHAIPDLLPLELAIEIEAEGDGLRAVGPVYAHPPSVVDGIATLGLGNRQLAIPRSDQTARILRVGVEWQQRQSDERKAQSRRDGE
jgi:hypothetical protein